jgi:hypothetical protein
MWVTLAAVLFGVALFILVTDRLMTWLDTLSCRLDHIEEDMYYEQADRDGVEYPPQWRRH